MSRFHALVLPLIVLLATHSPALAAKVKVWQQTLPSHFDKAQFKGAVISSEGAVRLSRLVRPLADLKALHIWSVVEDKTGNLYVATGDEGKLYKVAPDGTFEVAYTSTDSQILSLAITQEGTVFAGTGPGGKIVRLSPGQKPKVIAEKLGSYVWSLAFDETARALLAGTGPKGQIFQVTPEGQASVYLTTKQEHVLALAGTSGGPWYAGTDKGGLVYRLDGKGKGFVLYQATQGEIRSLAVQGDVVFAGTSAPVMKRPGGGGKPGGGPGPGGGVGGPPGFSSDLAANRLFFVAEDTFAQAPEFGKGTPAPAPSSAPPGDNSVYRIGPDGAVRELFRDKLLMLSLLPRSGRLLIGTGMSGQLFEVDETTKERTELARLDHGQILCLHQRQGGSILLATGDPGKLVVLENKFAAEGTLTSEVLDAKIVSRWGALTWKASTPPGSKVSVAVRSGNVAEPDATWSAWSAELTDSVSSKAIAPNARFFQYRLKLTTSDPAASPEVRNIALRYQTTNQAPEITSLDVPDLELQNLDNPRKFKIKWSATDPNEDELTFSLYLRKEGWKEWVLLEKDLDKRDFDWDTTTIPSGLYQIKVTAIDSRDNPPEEALAAQRISAAVPVANTPPTVTLKLAGWDEDRAVLEGAAAGPLVRIIDAAYAVDGKRWTNVFPTDGLFDSKTESFRFKTDRLAAGVHVVVLRVRDAAGNIASADVVFTRPATK